jgi:hypothetical protein
MTMLIVALNNFASAPQKNLILLGNYYIATPFAMKQIEAA